jgi:hypothetical protein
MTKTMNTCTCLTALGLFLAASSAAAQPTAAPNIFISLNGGVHASSEDVSVSAAQSLYNETATVSAEQTVGGGPMIDFSVGYRVWNDVSIALGLSSFSDTAQARATASVPHPAIFDRFATRELTVDDLKHSQRAVHLSVMWTTPIAEKMDGSILLGPSFIRVKQDLVTGITVPAGTQNADAVTAEESESAVGFHLGGDVTYAVTPRIGVGGLVRFVIGSVELPSAGDLSVNGFEIGGGVRVRF